MININRVISKLIYRAKRLGLRIIPSEFLEKVGQLVAIGTARATIKKVPAYKDFLLENNFSIKKIRSLSDFRKLPIMDKKNYFAKYSFERTLIEKSIYECYGWEQSSNYDLGSGLMLWPRFHKYEKRCVSNLDFMFRYLFGCEK